MSIREKFETPQRYKLWSYALIAVGVLSVGLLYITHGSSNDENERARFWGRLLQNIVYFLLLVNLLIILKQLLHSNNQNKRKCPIHYSTKTIHTKNIFHCFKFLYLIKRYESSKVRCF